MAGDASGPHPSLCMGIMAGTPQLAVRATAQLQLSRAMVLSTCHICLDKLSRLCCLVSQALPALRAADPEPAGAYSCIAVHHPHLHAAPFRAGRQAGRLCPPGWRPAEY